MATTKKRLQKKNNKPERQSLPSREDILAYIAEHPGEAGKREIARHFGIKGAARIPLKALLRELAGDGAVEGGKNRLKRASDLASVSVLDITGRDNDGELIAEPAEWPEERGAAPAIVVAADRGRVAKTPQPGVGDRILARLTPENGGYLARIIKVLDKKPLAVLGVVKLGEHGGRIEPVDRKQKELILAPEDAGKVKDDDLVSVTIARAGRYGLDTARIREVIGNLKNEKAVSMIAIHAHGIPFVFPPETLAEAGSAKPTSMLHREDWRKEPLVTIDPPDAKDHDDAVMAIPDPDPKNAGGVIVTVAIADVGWYVRPGTALDREALKRGNSVYFPDRVVPMLPR